MPLQGLPSDATVQRLDMHVVNRLGDDVPEHRVPVFLLAWKVSSTKRTMRAGKVSVEGVGQVRHGLSWLSEESCPEISERRGSRNVRHRFSG